MGVCVGSHAPLTLIRCVLSDTLAWLGRSRTPTTTSLARLATLARNAADALPATGYSLMAGQRGSKGAAPPVNTAKALLPCSSSSMDTSAGEALPRLFTLTTTDATLATVTGLVELKYTSSLQLRTRTERERERGIAARQSVVGWPFTHLAPHRQQQPTLQEANPQPSTVVLAAEAAAQLPHSACILIATKRWLLLECSAPPTNRRFLAAVIDTVFMPCLEKAASTMALCFRRRMRSKSCTSTSVAGVGLVQCPPVPLVHG